MSSRASEASSRLLSKSSVLLETCLTLVASFAFGCGLGIDTGTPKGKADRQAFSGEFESEAPEGATYMTLDATVEESMLARLQVALRLGQGEQPGALPVLQAEASANDSPLAATVIEQEALREMGLGELAPSNLGYGQRFALVMVDTTDQPRLSAALSAEFIDSPTQLAALQGETMSDVVPAPYTAPLARPVRVQVTTAGPASGGGGEAMVSAQTVQEVGSWGTCPDAVMKGLAAFAAGTVIAYVVVYVAIPAGATWAAGALGLKIAGGGALLTFASASAALALDMYVTRALTDWSSDIGSCKAAVMGTGRAVKKWW